MRQVKMKFKVGDYVRVIDNAKGTAWEYGKIMDINKQGALIGYGSKVMPDYWRIYGGHVRVPLNRLEKGD